MSSPSNLNSEAAARVPVRDSSPAPFSPATDWQIAPLSAEPVSDVSSRSPSVKVQPRRGAIIDPYIVRVASDAAVKHNTLPSRPGYASGSAKLQVHLHVEAWVQNLSFAKHLWIDLHVLDDAGALIGAQTVPLHYTRPAGDGGDVFVFDGTVYDGMVASPGSVTLRPDARHVQYRLYCEMNGRICTDAIAHTCDLRADSAST